VISNLTVIVIKNLVMAVRITLSDSNYKYLLVAFMLVEATVLLVVPSSIFFSIST